MKPCKNGSYECAGTGILCMPCRLDRARDENAALKARAEKAEAEKKELEAAILDSEIAFTSNEDLKCVFCGESENQPLSIKHHVWCIRARLEAKKKEGG